MECGVISKHQVLSIALERRDVETEKCFLYGIILALLVFTAAGVSPRRAAPDLIVIQILQRIWSVGEIESFVESFVSHLPYMLCIVQ